MSRDEEIMFKGDEAKRRLGVGIERSRALITHYRTRLLTLRDALDRQKAAVPVSAQSRPQRS